MHPVVDLGVVSLRTFGIVLFAALALAVAFAERRARRAGMPRGTALAAAASTLFCAWFGAKLVPVIVDPRSACASLEAVLRGLAFSGGAFYGGLAGGLFGLALFSRRRGVPLLPLLDVAAPAIALGQAAGRFACFFAGCDHGRPAPEGLPWAVTFADPRSLVLPSLLGVPLHPSALYESAGALVVLGLVLAAERTRFRSGFGPGALFALYVLLYAPLRFGLETFRGDARRGLHFGGSVSTSQLASALFLILASGAIMVAWGRRRKRRTGDSRCSARCAMP